MKSVLLGNGINMQFGGRAYTSEFIIKRIKYKAIYGEYKKLFNDSLDKNDILNILEGFVEYTNNILDNKYDDYVKEEDLIALTDFKNRYKKINEPHELMLEDWFFILHMFFLINPDLTDDIESAKQGFSQLILDSIYNYAEIQKLYLKMPSQVKKFFKGFENIFTLNYDNNLERLTRKPVYHLHGDFSVLADSENINNVTGFIREKERRRVVIKGLEHCYCNALLDYSGELKFKKAKKNHDIIFKTNELLEKKRNNKEEFEKELLKVKEVNLNGYKKITTKIENPNLEMASEYYFNKFEDIEDELYIIGMSPNNDGHIFNMINNNKKLNKIYFYYYSDWEKKYIEDTFSKDLYECKDVSQLWKNMKCDMEKYDWQSDLLRTNVDAIIARINDELPGDEMSKEEILNDLSNISKSQARKLAESVKNKLLKDNHCNIINNYDEKIKERAGITCIALSKGILPATLYLICVMFFNKI